MSATTIRSLESGEKMLTVESDESSFVGIGLLDSYFKGSVAGDKILLYPAEAQQLADALTQHAQTVRERRR